MATQAEAEEDDDDDEEEEENDTVENVREGDNNPGLLPSHEEFTDDEDIVDEDQDVDQMASELREEAARPRDS